MVGTSSPPPEEQRRTSNPGYTRAATPGDPVTTRCFSCTHRSRTSVIRKIALFSERRHSAHGTTALTPFVVAETLTAWVLGTVSCYI